MTAQTAMTLAMTGGGIAVVVWVLNKIGRALAAVLEALATVAVVFVALWLAVKDAFLLVRWTVAHWRTTLDLATLGAWAWWWGWFPVVVVLAVVGLVLLVCRLWYRQSFDAGVGRFLRSWWLRWTLYARLLPKWLRACGLTAQDTDRPIVLTANPLGRNNVRRQPKPRVAQVPRVLARRRTGCCGRSRTRRRMTW